jgi:hypothetical protein
MGVEILMPALSPTIDSTSGIGDVVFTAFLSPAQPQGLIWGAGPVVQMPTNSSAELGNKNWGMGPEFVVLHLDQVVGAAHAHPRRAGAAVLLAGHQDLPLLHQEAVATQLQQREAVQAAGCTTAEGQLSAAVLRAHHLRRTRRGLHLRLLLIDEELVAIEDLLHRGALGGAGGTRTRERGHRQRQARGQRSSGAWGHGSGSR